MPSFLILLLREFLFLPLLSSLNCTELRFRLHSSLTMAENPNGMYGEVAGEDADESFNRSSGGPHRREKERETLYGVFHRLISSIIFPQPDYASPLLKRIKISVSQNVPLIPEASRNTGRDVLLWTRRGSPLRALLVISVGAIACVALTGLLVFALFFLTATINAIVISLLMSLAAAGGFLALFFAFVTAIYIGALSVAIFTISTVTFWTIVAVVIITGWIAFFWTVWLVTKKSFGFAKHSLGVTGSAISTYTAARHARRLVRKDSD